MASHKSAEKRPSDRAPYRRELRAPQPRARLDQKVEGSDQGRRTRRAPPPHCAPRPEIQRGAIKHIIAKNAAARRVRLAARIKAMS